MKKIHIIEELCNGCRQCETFCSSLEDGVFSGETGRIRIMKPAGEEKDIPQVRCDGICVRSIFDDGRPTCVGLCPTGALFYTEPEHAEQVRQDYEAARKEHSIFRFLAPWKWPFPWRRPGEDKARSPEREVV